MKHYVFIYYSNILFLYIVSLKNWNILFLYILETILFLGFHFGLPYRLMCKCFQSLENNLGDFVFCFLGRNYLVLFVFLLIAWIFFVKIFVRSHYISNCNSKLFLFSVADDRGLYNR